MLATYRHLHFGVLDQVQLSPPAGIVLDYSQINSFICTCTYNHGQLAFLPPVDVLLRLVIFDQHIAFKVASIFRSNFGVVSPWQH